MSVLTALIKCLHFFAGFGGMGSQILGACTEYSRLSELYKGKCIGKILIGILFRQKRKEKLA